MSTSGTIRLGRVWSVPVRVRPGAVLMGVVLVALFAPRLDDAGYGRPWLVAVLAVASLYLSVLLHEVAHVAAARHYGLPVHSVTLHLLGGETLLESDSATARQELVTAISGPAASAVVTTPTARSAGCATETRASPSSMSTRSSSGPESLPR